jgi:predicted phosphodiesterase
MRYGIISDVHGNLPALEAVLSILEKQEIDKYFCIGDLVDYGANPKECIRIIKELNCLCVAGNHDWAVLGKIDIAYFSVDAQAAAVWTKACLSQEERDYLNTFELTYRNDDFILVHGTLDQPERFKYLKDIQKASETFPLMDRQVCFVGHSHIQKIFVNLDSGPLEAMSDEIELEEGYKYIVNIGSVGQPRDGNPFASYCVYDTDKKMIDIRRTNYDIGKAQESIVKAGLPKSLAQRLAFGR